MIWRSAAAFEFVVLSVHFSHMFANVSIIISLCYYLYICSSGAAYVFYSPDGISGWSQTAKLIASDGAASDNFGQVVSAWENLIVVGSWKDDTSGGGDAGESNFGFVSCARSK